MWSSVAASGFGDRVIMLAALTLLGGNKEGVDGTSLNAGIQFCFFLPYLLLGMPAGWLADRVPRKWIMLGCDESRALLLLLSFWLVPTSGEAAIGDDAHGQILAIIMAVGVFAAVFNPARNATIPQIVPTNQLQSANALIFGIAIIASMIGLGVGGKMFDPDRAASVRTGLLVGVLFFSISGTFFAFLTIRKRHRALTHGLEVIRRQVSGLPYVLSHRKITQLILINMLVWGAAMVVSNATVGLAKQQYGFKPNEVIERYTVLSMMIGLGMLCGAIWVSWMNTRRESMVVAMVSLLMAAVCTMGLAFVTRYAPALGLAFGIGFFGNTTLICVATLLQALSPNHIRGRVMGLNTLASTITTVGVNLVIWQIPNADGYIIVGLKFGAMTLAFVAVWGLWRCLVHGPLETRRLNCYWHIVRSFILVWHRLRWVHHDRVPSCGSVILASNHTTELDPFLIQMAVYRRICWVVDVGHRFPILNFFWSAVAPLMIDRKRNEMGVVQKIICCAGQGHIIGIFPEDVAQQPDGSLKPFHAEIGLIARQSETIIVPVWITGTPRTRHLLWHFLCPSRSVVWFGPPYRPDPAMSHVEVAKDLRRRMLELAPDGRSER